MMKTKPAPSDRYRDGKCRDGPAWRATAHRPEQPRMEGTALMKCDKCGKDAVVHITRDVDGQRIEEHYCEDCAKKMQAEHCEELADYAELKQMLSQHRSLSDFLGLHLETDDDTDAEDYDEYFEADEDEEEEEFDEDEAEAYDDEDDEDEYDDEDDEDDEDEDEGPDLDMLMPMLELFSGLGSLLGVAGISGTIERHGPGGEDGEGGHMTHMIVIHARRPECAGSDAETKIPKDAGEEIRKRREREALKARLAEAVRVEDYEKAAGLRDQLKAMEAEAERVGG